MKSTLWQTKNRGNLILTFVFAYLTYDSFSLAAPALPYSEIAKNMGQNLSHMSLVEREELNRYPILHRLGNINQTCWVFGVLTIGFAVATIRAFIE